MSDKYAEESARFRKAYEEKYASPDWTETERTADGIVIFKGPNFGEAVPAFRCEFFIPGVSPERVCFCLLDLKTRMSWDGGVTLHEDTKDLECVEKAGGGQRIVRLSVSMPALGGAISSREFVDLLDSELTGDGAEQVGVQWNADVAKQVGHKPSKGRVLGNNFPCGVRMLAQEDGSTKVVLLFHSVVNGWLPHSIVSQAMPATMKALAQRLTQAARQ